MPWELEWISESLHPLPLGLCDHPPVVGRVFTVWTGSDTEEGNGVETRGSFLQPWPLWWLCCKVSSMQVGALFLGVPPSLRAWRKPSTYGLHYASRSHYIISPQFTRIEQEETKEGLDNPKFASS